MKAFLLSLFIIFSLSFSYSQIEIHQNGVEVVAPIHLDLSFVLYQHFYIVNTSNTGFIIEFSMTKHEHNSGWGQSISDEVNCWTIPDSNYWERPTHAASFNELFIEAGDSAIFVFRTYPNLIADCGLYTFNFTDQNGLLFNSMTNQITFDGISCTSLNVEEKKNSISYRLYPNPALNNLNIEILNNENHSINIYNIAGKKMFSVELNQGLNQLDISSVPSGIYIYQILNDKGVLESKKLIVK